MFKPKITKTSKIKRSILLVGFLIFSLPAIPAIATENNKNSDKSPESNEILENVEKARTNNQNIRQQLDRTVDSAKKQAKQALIAQLQERGRQALEDFLAQQDSNSILGKIAKFLSGIQENVDSFLTLEIPDSATIIDSIFSKRDDPGSEAAKAIEAKPKGSYAITDDTVKQVTRDTIEDAVANNTTNKDAQTRTKKLLLQTEKAVKSSAELGEESAESDVSQQILQNISQQQSTNTQILGTIAIQNAQAQVDRANQTMLDIQQAETAQAEASTKRRKESMTSDLAVQQWGLMQSPVFIYEEAEE
jgi:hypothetical protein